MSDTPESNPNSAADFHLPFVGTARRTGHDLFCEGDIVCLDRKEDAIQLLCGPDATPRFVDGAQVPAIVGHAQGSDGELTVIFVPSRRCKGRLIGIAIDENDHVHAVSRADGRTTVGEHIVEDDGDCEES